MRESDIFARVGGEEFTVLLSDTSAYIKQKRAEEIESVRFCSCKIVYCK